MHGSGMLTRKRMSDIHHFDASRISRARGISSVLVSVRSCSYTVAYAAPAGGRDEFSLPGGLLSMRITYDVASVYDI